MNKKQINIPELLLLLTFDYIQHEQIKKKAKKVRFYTSIAEIKIKEAENIFKQQLN